MSSDPATTKLQFDLLLEETSVLNTMENWATTLFLTAIGLVMKQLVDWSNQVLPPPPAQSVPLHDAALVFPMAIGLLAFSFLRILNYRIRRVRGHQYQLVSAPRQWSGSHGLVGWSMAAMPMLFGVACSAYFLLSRPSLFAAFYAVLALDLLALPIAIAVFKSQSRTARDTQ